MLDVVFLIAAVVGGTILVCQFVLSLLGLTHGGGDLADNISGDFHVDTHVGGDLHGSHGGTDVNADHAHPDSTHMFAVISFRTLVAAMAFFGVTGLITHNGGLPDTTAVLLALAAGVCAMYGMYWLLRLIASLGSSGNEQIVNAMGLTATVYIPIPATRKGAGKVQLSMQNRIVEYQAVTDAAEPLKTGEVVEVVGVENSDTLHVRRPSQAARNQSADYQVAANRM